MREMNEETEGAKEVTGGAGRKKEGEDGRRKQVEGGYGGQKRIWWTEADVEEQKEERRSGVTEEE